MTVSLCFFLPDLRKFHANGIRLKTFPQSYGISLCGVVRIRCSGIRYSRVEPKVPGSSALLYLFFPFLLFFFFPFFVLLYFINMCLNNCYSIKCNKHQEKYDNRFTREKIVHRTLNIWINNLNFYHFLQFTVGKPELITI